MMEGGSTPGWPQRARDHRPQPASGAFAASPGVADPGLEEPPVGPTLEEILRTWSGELRRRWRLALLAFVLGFAPLVVLAVLSIPTYTATGVVQVAATGSALSANPLLELAGMPGNPNVETEIELMRRREFLLGVFKDLRLHIIDPHQPSGLTLDLALSLGGASPVSPALTTVREAVTIAEVDPRHAGDVPLCLTALDDARLQVELGEGASLGVHELRVGERLAVPPVTLEFAHLPLAAGEAVELVLRSDGLLLEQLGGSLSVGSVGPRNTPTNLVRVSFTATDRAIAQAVVARAMQRYVEQSVEWQTASASRAVDFIASQIKDVAERLSSQENLLREFSEQEHAVQLDVQAKATIENVAEIEAERHKITLQENLMDHVLGGMKGRIDKGKTHLTANFFDDPVLAASVAALTENEIRYEVLKATLTPAHPQVVDLGAQLKQQQQEVRRLMQSARRNLSSQAEELERQMQAMVSSLEAYPDKQLQLARLMRDVEVSERLYSFLLEKGNEAEILKASTATDKRVVDAASFPHRKTAPRRGRLLAMGLVSGLILAVAALYIARMLQRRLSSVEAITGQVAWPMYGMIPALAPAPAGGTLLAETWQRGPTAIAEAARSLAVSVSFAPAPAGRGRVVVLTSSRPGEGKSSVSANLAAALARTGARVLLVDLDLRKPTQHRLWHLPRAPGYAELVTQPVGSEGADKILHCDATHGVSVITAGARVADTTALVMADRLPAMLTAWAREYDYVLLDTPPAFVPDTSVVARLADLMLLIARPDLVERGELRRASQLLVRIPVQKGLVLSAVADRHLGFGYGGVEKYYNYGHGDGDDAGAARPHDRA